MKIQSPTLSSSDIVLKSVTEYTIIWSPLNTKFTWMAIKFEANATQAMSSVKKDNL